MNKLLLLGGAAVAAVLAFGGKILYNATRLQFYINHVGIKLDGLSLIVNLDVYAQNPTGSSYDISSIVGQVFFNNSLIGNAAFYQKTTVSPNAQTKIIIPIRVSLVGVGSQLVDIFNGVKNVQANMRIVGTVNVNNIPAPIDLTYSIV